MPNELTTSAIRRIKRHMNVTHMLKITVLMLLILGAYLVVQWVDFREVLSPERVMTYLNATGPFAPVVFMLLMAASVVISPIPSLPLDVAAGTAFGVLPGTVYAVIGAELGAILSFLVGRALGREALTRLLHTQIVFCERCSDRHLVIFVLLARLFPVFSFDLISYGAGLTNMSLLAFAVATLLGMIPGTLVLTSFGESLFRGEWPLIILSLVMVAFLLLVPKLVVRYPSSRWVRLLRGEVPVAGAPTALETLPIPMVPGTVGTEVNQPAPRCSSCGGPLE